MARGIIAIGIDKDDELVTARMTDGEQVIFLATHDGMAIRFDERDLRAMGRPAFGNRGICLKKGDYVIGAAVTPSAEASQQGPARLRRRRRPRRRGRKGHRTKPPTPPPRSRPRSPRPTTPAPRPSSAPKPPSSFRSWTRSSASPLPHPHRLRERLRQAAWTSTPTACSSRGGKGVINMKANSKVGKVVSIQLVDDTTEMMVISQFGKIIRIDTKSVRAAGRSTSGVRLLNLEQADGTMGSVADKVASATVIPPEDPKTNGENGTLVQ